jgi:hypothetical protein
MKQNGDLGERKGGGRGCTLYPSDAQRELYEYIALFYNGT